MHCTNRKSAIYKIKEPILETLFPKPEKKENKEIIQINIENCEPLTKEFTALKPQISPDNKKIAYFATDKKIAHANVMALHIIDIEHNTNKEIIGINGPFPKELEFAGINCNYLEMDQLAWLYDNNHLIFASL